MKQKLKNGLKKSGILSYFYFIQPQKTKPTMRLKIKKTKIFQIIH